MTDIASLYLEAVTRAYLAFKLAALDRLRNTRHVTWKHGLHQPSEAWGRVKALELVDPELVEVAPSLEDLTDAAERDAVGEFLADHSPYVVHPDVQERAA